MRALVPVRLRLLLVSVSFALAAGCGGGEGTIDETIDADGDGATVDIDCNDTNASVHPGATEVCDAAGLDEDCDGAANDADTGTSGRITFYVDDDHDDFGTDEPVLRCSIAVGLSTTTGDCDDHAANVHPDGSEVCDADDADEDCDGVADDDDSSVDASTKVATFADADTDGFGAGAAETFCDAPVGRVLDATDCDPDEAAIHPGATEICDATDVDEDCDGLADDADSAATGKVATFLDADLDGFGAGPAAMFCDVPAGRVLSSTDCLDSNGAVRPNGAEVCDAQNQDEDCDGLADDADVGATGTSSFYVDGDSDGFGGGASVLACDVPSGHVANDDDCDDATNSAHPGGTEVCDGTVDEDCDGLVDDADPTVTATIATYADTDEDGYGAGAAIGFCVVPTGRVVDSSDCGPDDDAVHPGGVEVCDPDDVDEDCDGSVDDADPTVVGRNGYYVDEDDDGFGVGAVVLRCDAPAGHASVATDCDDDDDAIHPGASELCDASHVVDEDCDGLVDDADSNVQGLSDLYVDADEDGSGAGPIVRACGPATLGWSYDPYDCDDEDPDVHFLSDTYVDADGDGHGAGSMIQQCHMPATGYSYDPFDCDDEDPEIHNMASELCDDEGIDENCNGLVNDDDVDSYFANAIAFWTDEDRDGFGTGGARYLCVPPAGSALADGDCNDDDDAIHPDADEVCDAASVDENCNYASNDDDATTIDRLATYYDGDDDGYGIGDVEYRCVLPDDRALVDADCDDGNDAAHPGADEVCDLDDVDEDCDGLAEDADAHVGGDPGYADEDGDGFGAGDATYFCEVPDGYAANDTDCDDEVATTNPAADEICGVPGVDEDCNDLADDADPSLTGPLVRYGDADGDGYGSGAGTRFCVVVPPGVETGGDCDETSAAVHPGATETCDGEDSDCDGTVDFGFTVPTIYPTVQEAIEAAPEHAHVCILEGTYDRFYSEKSLTIEGEDRDTTIIETTTGGRSVFLRGFSGTISGLTITGADGMHIDGGGAPIVEDVLFRDNVMVSDSDCSGILHIDGTAATIRDVDFVGNSVICAGVTPGIISSGNGDTTTTLERVSIVDNTISGGVSVRGIFDTFAATIAMKNVIIAGNELSGSLAGATSGALIASLGSALPTSFDHVTFVGNRVDESLPAPLALIATGGDLLLTNSVLVDNTADSGAMRFVIASSEGSTIAYCDFFGNASHLESFHSTLADPIGEGGNFALPPGFASYVGADPVAWDLRPGDDSQLTDAGDPAEFDLDASVCDIGAYGGLDATW